jgi:hypothetical protein
MGTSSCCVPRILARHCSRSHRHHFFAVGVVIGVVIIVAANGNTAARGRQSFRLAIIAAILRLVVAVIVLVSAIAIAWDDDDKLPVVLLRLVCTIYLYVGGIGKVTPPLTLLSRLRYVGILGLMWPSG